MPHGAQLVDGLANAIARTRDVADAEATEIAEQLVMRDSKNQILIGLQANGEHVVYFQFSLRAIEAVPYDEVGIDGIAAKHLLGSRGPVRPSGTGAFGDGGTSTNAGRASTGGRIPRNRTQGSYCPRPNWPRSTGKPGVSASGWADGHPRR